MDGSLMPQRSFKGRIWKEVEFDPMAYAGLRKNGVDPSLARILASRAVDADSLQDFLVPAFSKTLPDPHVLLGMKEGARRIAKAVVSGQRIGIWSDYDVDGATSAAVLGKFLRLCGHDDFVVRIPDRLTEGYGPNAPGLVDMKENQGCNLVVILDAGTVAFDALEAARRHEIEIVVIDHHMAEEDLPPAVAVINPNRKDQPPGLGHLCAAGVTFLFAIAVSRFLKNAGHFQAESDGAGSKPPMPVLQKLLPFVALGTVCDVVPLVGVNRALVFHGLRRMNNREDIGIQALADASGHDQGKPLDEQTCGWQFGPRINAGGRISSSLLGAQLLLENDPDKAAERADELQALNEQRRALDASSTEQAMAQLSHLVPGENRELALAVVDAHEGVVGISASRIKDSFDAPSIVLTEAHGGLLKGSARSVPGFDIGHAIIAARQTGLIIKGGGHGMEGGLTLSRDQLDAFVAFMNAEIRSSDYYREGVATRIDLSLSLSDLSVDLIENFDALRPFGTANPEPAVMLAGAELAEIRVLKEKHFKVILRDGRSTIDALKWNVEGTELAARIRAAMGKKVDVLGSAQINEFRGNKRPQMMIDDIRLSV